MKSLEIISFISLSYLTAMSHIYSNIIIFEFSKIQFIEIVQHSFDQLNFQCFSFEYE